MLCVLAFCYRYLIPCLRLLTRLADCGDVADEAANGGAPAPAGDCSFPCSGDPIHLCGGAQRLQLYHWDGNIDVWNTPANTGRYEVSLTFSARGLISERLA